MWVLKGGPPETPLVWFHYDPHRSQKIVRSLLLHYEGVVQSDGQEVYAYLDHVEGVILLGCWAHARRKFVDVLKAVGTKKPKKNPLAQHAIDVIKEFYLIERQAKENQVTPQQLLQLRQQKAVPLLDEFHQWLITHQPLVPEKGLLGKAINYALNQWHRLRVYTDIPQATPDNNAAENAIRPFVIGRKNWLFNQSVQGAVNDHWKFPAGGQ